MGLLIVIGSYYTSNATISFCPLGVHNLIFVILAKAFISSLKELREKINLDYLFAVDILLDKYILSIKKYFRYNNESGLRRNS